MASLTTNWADAADEEEAEQKPQKVTTTKKTDLNPNAELPPELKNLTISDKVNGKDKNNNNNNNNTDNKKSDEKEKKESKSVQMPLGKEAFATQILKVLPDGSKEYLGEKTFEQCVKEDGLPAILKESIDKKFGYTKMTKIQVATVPDILKGKHIFAQGKNGSGKTFAFGLGILGRIDANIKQTQAIVICNTRELVQQQYNVFEDLTYAANGAYTFKRVIPTGRDEKKDNAKITEHIIIGTAGSIFGKLENRKITKVKDSLKCIVLDEADNLMGSAHTMKIIKHKTFKHRNDIQIIAFSATYSADNKKKCLALLKNPIKIEVAEEDLVLKKVKQYYMKCLPGNDPNGLNHILHVLSELFGCELGMKQMIVFVNRRAYGKQVAEYLRKEKHTVGELYGGKGKDAMTPRQRDQVLSDFIQKRTTRLVSTDVIGRGIDIPDVTHVISIELPKLRDKVTPDPEAYLQRVGRAGRMGRKGVAITLIPNSEQCVQNIKSVGDHWKNEIEEVSPYLDIAKPEEIPDEIWEKKFKVE